MIDLRSIGHAARRLVGVALAALGMTALEGQAAPPAQDRPAIERVDAIRAALLSSPRLDVPIGAESEGRRIQNVQWRNWNNWRNWGNFWRNW